VTSQTQQEVLLMPKKAQSLTAMSLAQVDPQFVAPGVGEVVFLMGDGGQGAPIIREGQHVSYEIEQREDGLFYAVNIVIEDEPPLN
jgi:hypothetical protein